MSYTAIVTPILSVGGLILLAGIVRALYFLVYKRIINNALKTDNHIILPEFRIVVVILCFIICFAVMIFQSIKISKLRSEFESRMDEIAENFTNIYNIIDESVGQQSGD